MSENLEYTWGYNAKGIDTLISEVKGYVISGAAELAVDNVDDVESVCKDYWDGTARENFITNLRTDADLFKTNITNLYNAFVAEINNAGTSFQNFDENLIETK